MAFSLNDAWSRPSRAHRAWKWPGEARAIRGFDLGVGGCRSAGEVGVVERQRQPRHGLDQAGRRGGRRRDRADVGLDREREALQRPRAASTRPRQFVAATPERVGLRLALEENPRQGRRHADPPALDGRVVERLREPSRAPSATRRVGVIRGEGFEFGGGLEEDVGEFEAAVGELPRQRPCRAGDVLELPRRPEVRTAFEQADVHSVELEERDQVEPPCRESAAGKVKSAQASFGIGSSPYRDESHSALP